MKCKICGKLVKQVKKSFKWQPKTCHKKCLIKIMLIEKNLIAYDLN